MARLGGYFLPDQPLHVIQRGNNRAPIFFAADDYARYRRWLADAATDYGCAIDAYALMTNHVHLLVTPANAESLPRTMQSWPLLYSRKFCEPIKRAVTRPRPELSARAIAYGRRRRE